MYILECSIRKQKDVKRNWKERARRKRKTATEMFHYFLTLHMNIWRVSYHRNRIKKIWGNLIMITKHNELLVTTSKWFRKCGFYMDIAQHIHILTYAPWIKTKFMELSVIKGIGYSSEYITCLHILSNDFKCTVFYKAHRTSNKRFVMCWREIIAFVGKFPTHFFFLSQCSSQM